MMIYKTDCIYGGLVTVYELVKKEPSKTIIFTEVIFLLLSVDNCVHLQPFMNVPINRKHEMRAAVSTKINGEQYKKDSIRKRWKPRSADRRLVVQVAMFQASHGLFSFRPHSVL